jgi:twinkle protein
MTKSLLENREWLRTFGEVVLCFDNDEAGKKATDEAIKIIGIDKAKIVKYPKDCKDSNDVLKKFGSARLLQCVFDSQPWSPAGIISKEDIWKQITERNALVSVPYPPCLEGINKKIKGMRLGEIALFISGTGSGKSTVVREIELHLLETTNDKIGVISLEESPGETGIKLSGMAIHKNPSHNEIPDEELKVGFDKVFGTDRVVVLDHQGSIKDDSIIDQLEYMCLIGCKYLFIDHITILVSEGADGLTGNEAIDKIMNDLLRLVKRHNVYICLISHLRKVQTGGKSFEEGRIPSLDDIRGSGSIKQVSFDVIAFARDMNNAEEYVRNTICMAVLKSRTMALTGPVEGAVYNNVTGRLTAFNATAEEFTKV